MKSRRIGRTGAEKRTRRMHIARKVLSILLLLLCAVPMMGGGVRALWVIPAVMCICMNEEPYFCMAAGVIAGICIDLACDSPLCANAIFLVCCCTAASVLFSRVFRRSFVNYLGLTLLCVLLRAGVSYGLTVLIHQIQGKEALWNEMLLPSAIGTMVAALPVYLLYLPVSRLLTKRVRSMDAAAVHRE